jgi:hypothetical protein
MNMKRLSVLIISGIVVFAATLLFAQTNRQDVGGVPGMDHGAPQHGSDARTAPTPLPEPAKTVFTNYLKIQAALAQDSLEGVSSNAAAIERSIGSDAGSALPSGEVAAAAKDLAKAADLTAARAAFQPLSESLIKYLDAHKDPAGNFIHVHCSMVNADWLQTGTEVANPYLGKSMPNCGEIGVTRPTNDYAATDCGSVRSQSWTVRLSGESILATLPDCHLPVVNFRSTRGPAAVSGRRRSITSPRFLVGTLFRFSSLAMQW